VCVVLFLIINLNNQTSQREREREKKKERNKVYLIVDAETKPIIDTSVNEKSARALVLKRPFEHRMKINLLE